MTYNVIIPVVSRDLAVDLLNSMADNTILPDQVLIIDNSLAGTTFDFDPGLSVDIIYMKKRLDVNASWNLGISYIDDCDYLAILNDDVLLGKYFFEKNINIFRQYTDCGVACPDTVHNIADMKTCGSGKIIRMKKREGWAFSFRYSLLKKIPSVPDVLKTFCGDDWFWAHTHSQNYCWYKDTGNIVYHKVGAAVKKLGARAHLKQDKTYLRRMLQLSGYSG